MEEGPQSIQENDDDDDDDEENEPIIIALPNNKAIKKS